MRDSDAVSNRPEGDVCHEGYVSVAVDQLPICRHHGTPIHVLQTTSPHSQIHQQRHQSFF